MLPIQVLIGADYQWDFLEGEEIREGPHEPVAIRTSLGWVFSGQLKGESISYEVSFVSFVQSDDRNENNIRQQVKNLWGLNSIGFRPKKVDHKALVDIKFTGDRYSVKLPWKTGRGPIPIN